MLYKSVLYCLRVVTAFLWSLYWRQVKPQPAYLRVEVQILPQADADLDPMKEGTLVEPQGRIGWQTMLQHPGKFLQTFVGPKRYAMCICLGKFLAISVFLILVLGILVLFTNFMSPWISLWNNR